MSFTIHPLTPTDAPLCTQIYFSSFSRNIHSLACFPRSPSTAKWFEKMFNDELNEPGAHWLKTVDSSTGRMVGFAKWVDSSRKPELLGQVEWPEGADEKLCEETFGAWAEKRVGICGGRGHWYLEMIATAPEFQGRGVGSAMIKWGLQRADAEGSEAYLESSLASIALYEKFGFKQISSLDHWMQNERGKGGWYREVFMLRPATKS